MKLPAALRLALVPIGIAIAHKGLSYLTDEADRLGAEIDARRGELAHYSEVIGAQLGREPGATDEPAPEDFPPAPANSSPSTEDPPAELHRTGPRIRVGAVVANAAAFGLGAYLSMRATAWMQQRALAAELVAAAIRENESRPVDPLPEPAPGTCGVFPAFGEPPTPCTLPPHESFRHSWEGGRGDEPAPTPEQVWDTYAEPAAFIHAGPCDPDDCPTCRRIRKQ